VQLWNDEQRRARRHGPVPNDQRGDFQRDRDRILYCSAFRRLGGVTQIVRAGESDVFHNRLSRTIKVAQVGRRLAEAIISRQGAESRELGVDPEVVEAACLAHDLGHPPFGHHGEMVLNQLVIREGNPDGYEGNAQSLRILTNLALRFDEVDGLDLTRATLAAVIKYPWLRDPNNPKRSEKWGYYQTEATEFEFAREFWPCDGKTAEAEIMDFADDIAYSVHDLEDFHRCRGIPWAEVFSTEGCERLTKGVLSRWKPNNGGARLRGAHRRLREFFDIVRIGFL
jgi:dGTPase